jgi:hypothetical protein
MAIGPSYKSPRKGQALTAKGLDANIVKGPQRGMAVSGNADLRRFQDGLSVDLPDSGGVAGASNYFRWAQIISVSEDYLVCKAFNVIAGTTSGDNFNVAKPYLLQQYPFNGESITYIDGETITYTKDATDPEYKRNHNDGVTSADFVITPNYFVGERIIIMKVPTYINATLYNWVELAMGRYWAQTS